MVKGKVRLVFFWLIMSSFCREVTSLIGDRVGVKGESSISGIGKLVKLLKEWNFEALTVDINGWLVI